MPVMSRPTRTMEPWERRCTDCGEVLALGLICRSGRCWPCEDAYEATPRRYLPCAKCGSRKSRFYGLAHGRRCIACCAVVQLEEDR